MVPTILLLSPHLCCQHFNFWRQGRSSEPQDALNTDQCPLFTHYSWITTTTSQYRFKDFKEYGDTCIYDLCCLQEWAWKWAIFVCRFFIVPSKGDECRVFFCVKMCDGAITKWKPETRKWIHYAKRNTGLLNFCPRNDEK